MDTITRGTTPTINIQVDMNLSGYACELSMGRYGKPFFTAKNDQMQLTAGTNSSTCKFKLTQEQTLKCKAGVTNLQLRAAKNDDAIATEPIEIEVLNVIEQSIVGD